MKKNSIVGVSVKWHIIFWTFYISYKVAFENIRVTSSTDSVDTILIHLIHIANFYYVLTLLDRHFNKNKVKFFVYLLIGYLIYLCFLHFYCKILIRAMGHGLYYKYLGKVDTIIDGTDFYFQFSIYAIGFWFVSLTYKSRNKLLTAETENLSLKNEKLQLENEKMKLQYSYLKSQVNPHFLYNTLACFHEEASKYNDDLAEGIAGLSALMRHTLHEGDMLSNVPLSEEIERLKQYIQLHKMRYGSSLEVNFHADLGLDERITIPPFILITLVENAFKHGVFSKNSAPLTINTTYKENKLEFKVSNMINTATPKIQSTGMGLHNVSERLRLAYGNAYTLTYGVFEDDIFNVTLIISYSGNFNLNALT